MEVSFNDVIIAVSIVVIILLLFSKMSEGMRSAYANPVQSTNTTVIKMHYAPWCPACNRIQPVWETMRRVKGITFVDVDETQTPTPGITRYPTFVRIDGAGEYHYRDINELGRWLQNYTAH